MECIFCKIANGEIPSYKIYEDEIVYAFLDINQQCPGHTLIIPKAHTLDLQSIDNDTLTKIMDSAKKLSLMITEKMESTGYTLFQNNGSVQEVKHFHLHIIPKYNKKFNISIEDVYKKITG